MIGGLGGVLSVIDLYFRRFYHKCSVELRYPNGTRVSLANLSRKTAIKMAREHQEYLANDRVIVELGEAKDARVLSTKMEFATEAVSQIRAIEVLPRSHKAVPKEHIRSFDVFLSHNSNDKPTVRIVGELLKKRGISVWLDEWELVPGQPWQEALEEVVLTAKSVAVLVGCDGIGPWQDREMRACLSEFVKRGLPVIPVLLPGALTEPDLPIFLKQFTWVDLRQGLSQNGLDRLQWGITGEKPNG
jgi:TIR domain